jgi:hypothetical protein
MYCKLENIMHILGIHIDFPFLRMTRIRKSRQGIHVYWTKTLSLVEEEELIEALPKPENGAFSGDPSPNVKPQYKTPENGAFSGDPSPNVKPLYIENFRGKIVSALGAKDFLVRTLEIKIASQKHLEEAIAFQSEALSHFKLQEILTVPVIEKREKDKAEALLFTVVREGLRAHLEKLQSLGIDPDSVSTSASALCHFVQWKFPELTDAFLVDLGSEIVTCVFLEKGNLKKAHAIPIGIEELLAALYEDRKRILLKKEIEGAAKQLDLLLLKSQLNPHLSDLLTSLRQELSKVFYSFTRNGDKPVLFTGRSDAFLHLREYLFDFSEELWPLSIEEQKGAIPLGLCIEQTKKDPLQLRKEEFFPRKNWIRMGKIALCLLCCSFALSASLVWLGIKTHLKSKETMLGSFHTLSHKSLLKEGAIEEQIDQWIDTIEKNNEEYPFIMGAPKVTEVLSWISTHPLLEELRMEGDPIDIQAMRVQLLHFPTPHDPRENYLAKVELEFSLNSMMNARRFHEALRMGDAWVDPNLEITWDVLNQGYRTTFYLKNRAIHVP